MIQSEWGTLSAPNAGFGSLSSCRVSCRSPGKLRRQGWRPAELRKSGKRASPPDTVESKHPTIRKSTDARRLPAEDPLSSGGQSFCQASVKAVKADKSNEFSCYSAARESRSRRRHQVYPPPGSTVPKLPNAVLPWSPTLKLNASEVKSKADWLVKYLARTCNEAGHADLIIMPDQSRR